MKIALITPAPPHSRHGNRHTAARWAAMLRTCGHRVTVEQSWGGRAADVMIALHARRSHDSAQRFKLAHPDRPLVVVLTGTDLYRDIRTDASARASLDIADRLVVLQDQGPKALPARLRSKTRVIYQSTPRISRGRPPETHFEVVVSGHLRSEKDPFRAALALQHLPARSRIRIVHLGAAMSDEMACEARAWVAREPRYHWLGERPHGVALRGLAGSHLMILSSRMEGGANVISEALAAGVPVIASRIPGNIGMLGTDYRGYFAVENERALARLLWRAESDSAFYSGLKKQCLARRALVDPQRESQSLERLLREVAKLSVPARPRSRRRY